jgi:hypothetical protein
VSDLDALLARLKMEMDTHPDDGGQVLLADGIEDCYEAITRLRAEVAALKAGREVPTSSTRCMVRLDGVWITPDAALAEIDRLRAELGGALRQHAALKAKFEGLNDAVEEACGELPEGWQVCINMEHGAGWVDLFDPDGDCIEVHEDETSVPDLVREAIRRAKEGQR